MFCCLMSTDELCLKCSLILEIEPQFIGLAIACFNLWRNLIFSVMLRQFWLDAIVSEWVSEWVGHSFRYWRCLSHLLSLSVCFISACSLCVCVCVYYSWYFEIPNVPICFFAIYLFHYTASFLDRAGWDACATFGASIPTNL